MNELILTRHARERSLQRLGRRFDLAGSMARARTMRGSEYRRQKAFIRSHNGQLRHRRRDMLIDPRTGVVYITRQEPAGRVVITLWRMPLAIEALPN